MSFNDENVTFSKPVSREYKVAQNGFKKWIFLNFFEAFIPVNWFGLAYFYFILENYCICDLWLLVCNNFEKVVVTCSVPLWALKYFWEGKQLQQQKLLLHWHTRMSHTVSVLQCPSGVKNPTGRWRILPWVHIVGLGFFPCKHHFIPLLQCLDGMWHWLGATGTGTQFREWKNCKPIPAPGQQKVDFSLDVQNTSYHYAGQELIVWVSIVDVCNHLFCHSFLVRKSMWISQVAIVYFHVFPRIVFSWFPSSITHFN